MTRTRWGLKCFKLHESHLRCELLYTPFINGYSSLQLHMTKNQVSKLLNPSSRIDRKSSRRQYYFRLLMSTPGFVDVTFPAQPIQDFDMFIFVFHELFVQVLYQDTITGTERACDQTLRHICTFGHSFASFATRQSLQYHLFALQHKGKIL